MFRREALGVYYQKLNDIHIFKAYRIYSKTSYHIQTKLIEARCKNLKENCISQTEIKKYV